MTAIEAPSDPQQRSSLMKGLAVLEAVASHQRVSDISAATGLSVSTVHRMLRDLTEHGWVEQSEDRTYRPGLRVQTLVSLLQNEERLVDVALPYLQALRERVRFTVHMARYGQDGLVYIAKIDGPASYQMRSRVGDSIPLWSTAIGKAVLAAMDEKSSRSLIATATLERRTPQSLTSKRALWEQVEVIRDRGWSMDDGENELHIRCVGTVLRDSSGRVVGGISCSGLDHDMTSERVEQIAPMVIETAMNVERAFAPKV
ncbi:MULTISPECIES: IclR family transcriptional regulator [unclassified Arthrobacter]|uniref:IclR family transcriptional regulator n=1 Tax=unclassified Arthrobacter TaxID=235627 RepID=UPI001E4BFBD5|nr:MULTISPECIES: IclR family transcriptional regulator [unclassified Arthrobacter]MCC9146845.1 IclR family transcriptional regulator [Arthrobacter sp. zg-Y919]MDK1278076.1 IclR family transcriptional regulator [Arthrobacter sp. zg.Y919]WIB03336.1 IclR family transcriptional regulator [Arthrobacter sp. zg-Y919]